jgi:hypothetical protein
MEGQDDLRPIGTDQSLPPTCDSCGHPYAYVDEYPVEMPAFAPSPADTSITVVWVCRRCQRTQGYMKAPPD